MALRCRGPYATYMKVHMLRLCVIGCPLHWPTCRPGQYGVAEIGVPVEEEELPAEAHHTLFASGLPLDMQKREASHIFRPFEGYKASPGCQNARNSAARIGLG